MIAVAESCTGGAIMAKLVERPGASQWFAGGQVLYQDADKIRFGVRAEDIATHTSQSALVTEELARLVREHYGAETGLAVTGNADEGHGWVAICTSDGVDVEAVHASGSRVENIAAFRDAALALLPADQLP
ncbi:MAG: CinA family protein [Thermoplasmatota archaeon]